MNYDWPSRAFNNYYSLNTMLSTLHKISTDAHHYQLSIPNSNGIFLTHKLHFLLASEGEVRGGI